MDKKKVIGIVLTVMLALNALVAGAICFHQFMDAKQSEKAFDDLQKMVIVTEPTEFDSEQNAETEEVDQTEQEHIASHEKYQALYVENNDFVGWIEIDGTEVNYPVMQTPQNPNFYLKHSFYKTGSNYGVPYVDEKCAVDQSNNITIYGHSMTNGTMFDSILNYEDEDFYKEHPKINFDTLHSYGEYEVIAAFRFDTNHEDFFYNEFHDMDQESFDKFISECMQRRLYDTGKKVEFGDHLLTLSTCEYTYENGRFVVVARKVAE